MKIPVAPLASQCDSLPRIFRDTTNDGNVLTLPPHTSSNGDDVVLYAEDPSLVEKLKGSFDENGSYTFGYSTSLRVLMAEARVIIAVARYVLLAAVSDMVRFV